MPKNSLTHLLKQQSNNDAAEPSPQDAPSSARVVYRTGEVNISAYFPAEVKAALRHVQAKTGKSIKGCLSEALQLLFRKHNVAVTVADDGD
jgi:hypothetical protein